MFDYIIHREIFFEILYVYIQIHRMLTKSYYMLELLEILVHLATTRRSQWRRSISFMSILNRLHRGTRNESRNQWRTKTIVE